MAFLLDPDISTADVYTTLAPELSIVHDQITIQWEHSDLELFPVIVASQYKFMMGAVAQASAEDITTKSDYSAATVGRTITPIDDSVTTSSTHQHKAGTSTTVIWPTSHYGATTTTTTTSTTITPSPSTTEPQDEPTTPAPTTYKPTETTTATKTNSSSMLSKSIASAIICFAVAAYIMV